MNFFSTSVNCDSDYESLIYPINEDYQRCRDFVDFLWRDYSDFADKNFLTNAKTHFHQRFWEMYLSVTFLRKGYEVIKTPDESPDVCIKMNGKKLWIEAVAPGPGTGPDQIPIPEFGKANWVPTDLIALRYLNVFNEKHAKYKKYMQKGIVSCNDIFVIAINCNKVPHAYFGSTVPYHVQALLPIGPPNVIFNIEKDSIVETGYSFKDSVMKNSGSKVEKKAFTDPKYSGVSAVINSGHEIAGYTMHKENLGFDFDFLHNPLAINPLGTDTIPWAKNRYVTDDQLFEIKPVEIDFRS
jgi:hypothetical protein